MKPITRLLAATAALGVALAAVLVAVPNQPEADAAVQRTLRIPAAAFESTVDLDASANYGQYLNSVGTSYANFVAPVFLEGNSATVHSVTLHYWDGGSDRICFSMDRVTLKTLKVKTMAGFCTRNAIGEPRSRTAPTVHPSTVDAGQAAYIWVQMPDWDSDPYRLIGVTIVYTSDV